MAEEDTTPDFVQAWKKVRFLRPGDAGFLPAAALEALEKPVRDWIKQQNIDIKRSNPIDIPRKQRSDSGDYDLLGEDDFEKEEKHEEKKDDGYNKLSSSFMGLWRN